MRNYLRMRYPAAWPNENWREATPVGNGQIGALVYGGVYHEIIAINHAKLWWDYVNKPMPDVSHVIPKMRELLLQNKVVEAENLIGNEFATLGYKGTKLGRPLPLCDIDIVTYTHDCFKHYSRELDMSKAQALVKWQEGDTQYRRSFFVSRVDDTAYYKIEVDGDALYNASFSLKVHDLQTIADMTPPGQQETICKDGFIYYAAHKEEDDTDFGAVCYIRHNGTECYEKDAIRIRGASRIDLCLKTFIEGDRKECFEKLEAEITKDFDYDAELEKHAALHREIFEETVFQIGEKEYGTANEELLLEAYEDEAPEELVEKLWSFGRYLLVCATKPDGYPCTLYGLWMGGYKASWPWNMFNVNVQIIYWQALSGNMPELLKSVFHYVEERMDDFRENARKIFGCRGINICAVNTPYSNVHKIYNPHIINWTGGAGWVAQHYYDYWLCTRDEEFLRERAMPFMYEALLFYEDFLFEDENGYFVFAPSNSPENIPLNVERDLHSTAQVTVNATMDFAILKELLTNMIEAVSTTGKYTEKLEMWKSMLKKIPDYQINKDGALAEWMHPFYEDNYAHRHESHLYPVFPGTEITEKNNPVMHQAAAVAVEKRKVVGLKDQSGWSLSYMANVYARLGKGDEALGAINCLAKSNVMRNLLTLHNDWRRMGVADCVDLYPPVQVDANMGIVAAINEMFAFSTKDEIYLFRAMPKKWKSGKMGPLLLRTNTKATFEWKEDSAKVELCQLNSRMKALLVLPADMCFASDGKQERELILEKGQQVVLEIQKIC